MNFWKHANSNRGVVPHPKRVRPAGGLGPKQIEWCRSHIPAFREAADRAAEMKRQAQSNRAALVGNNKSEDTRSS